jgi:hypothetical protein
VKQLTSYTICPVLFSLFSPFFLYSITYYGICRLICTYLFVFQGILCTISHLLIYFSLIFVFEILQVP